MRTPKLQPRNGAVGQYQRPICLPARAQGGRSAREEGTIRAALREVDDVAGGESVGSRMILSLPCAYTSVAAACLRPWRAVAAHWDTCACTVGVIGTHKMGQHESTVWQSDPGFRRA